MHTSGEDSFVMSQNRWSLCGVGVHVLSKLLLTEIFHQLHIHAKDFVLTKQLESFFVYNAFGVAVVGLLMQNQSQEYPSL